MKKLFSLLLISTLLVTGCSSSDKEKEKKEPIKDAEQEVVDDNKMTKNEVIVEAKTIAQAAVAQYSKNTQNGTYINAGSVGELNVKNIYPGFWCYDEEAGSIVIKDVEIEDYICSGNIEVMECKKK